MAKREDIRPVITLRSTEGTGASYTTRKNRRNTTGRLELKKYDSVLRKHVIFRETR
jgi:large subunit ribosomal protein L33